MLLYGDSDGRMFATTGSRVTVGTMFSLFFFFNFSSKNQLGTGTHPEVSLVALTCFCVTPPPPPLFFFSATEVFPSLHFFCRFFCSISVGGKVFFLVSFCSSCIIKKIHSICLNKWGKKTEEEICLYFILHVGT